FKEVVQRPRSLVMERSLRAHVPVACHAVAGRAEHLTGDFSRIVAGEENHDRRDIGWIEWRSLSLTTGRDPKCLLMNRIGHSRCRDRKDRIACDSITAQALSGAEGQAKDSCFSRCVTGLTGTA